MAAPVTATPPSSSWAPHIPVIPPAGGASHPQWSVMIPAYNCIRFLKQTLESVLAQDPGPSFMQIEVVDDGSTDGDVAALVAAVGNGRISYYRQPRNVGSFRNFETCLKRSTGKWIHLLHGDDMVKPGFYTEIEKLFQTYPEAGAAFTGTIQMNEKSEEGYHLPPVREDSGIVPGWLQKIARQQLLQAPAIVVRRDVYEKLGGFMNIRYGEDWEMYARIAAHYPVAFSPALLALYRVHHNSISARSVMDRQISTDILHAMQQIATYLPAMERASAENQSRRVFSIYFARLAHDLLRVQHNKQAALRQSNDALHMQVNRTTVWMHCKLLLKMIFR